MNTSADERIADVQCTNDSLVVDLVDGRTVSVPLAWFPRLLSATPRQRSGWRIVGGGYGIHWPAIDEDISSEGLLRGTPALAPSRQATGTPATAETSVVLRDLRDQRKRLDRAIAELQSLGGEGGARASQSAARNRKKGGTARKMRTA